jgi:hypothetical protein
MIREAAFTALFGLIQAMKPATFVTVSRRLRLLEEMDSTELPAAFLQLGSQTVTPRASTPPKRILRAHLLIYVAAPDDTQPSGPALNNLIDAVEAALAPLPYLDAQTLGGAVTHAWIEGTIETYEAVKKQQAAALIPITMLLP